MKQRQRSLIKLRERQPKATLIPFNAVSVSLSLFPTLSVSFLPIQLPNCLSLSLSVSLTHRLLPAPFGEFVEDLTCVCNLVAFHFSRKVVRLFCWLFITFALVSLQFVGFPTRSPLSLSFSLCQLPSCLCFNFSPGIVSFMTNKQTFENFDVAVAVE